MNCNLLFNLCLTPDGEHRPQGDWARCPETWSSGARHRDRVEPGARLPRREARPSW